MLVTLLNRTAQTLTVYTVSGVSYVDGFQTTGTLDSESLCDPTKQMIRSGMLAVLTADTATAPTQG